MKEKWNSIKIVTMILLVLLVLVAGVLPLIGGLNALGLSTMPDQYGRFQGEMPEGMTFPQSGTPPAEGDIPSGGNESFQPGQGNSNPPSDMSGDRPDDGMNMPQGQGRSSQNSSQMKLQRLTQYGAGGAVLLFGLLGIIGLWFDKKWSKIMIVITGAIVIVSASMSIINAMGTVSIVEAVVKLVLAVAVILLSFLRKKTIIDVT